MSFARRICRSLAFADGRLAEFGYHPVDVVDGAAKHPLLEGLAEAPSFRHAHALHVADVPAGYATYMSTPITPVQLAIDDDRKHVGAQFHPEYWTDEHPDGRTLIQNFLGWSGISR